ncbi:helicase associated domain-containing protein [Streptomyces hirsutus]|uniref:helicase associated domain-containing protein n=1 Tax=Streptomyces hirsutus TaxID=35620 RepID=UPI00331DE71F
MIKARSSLPNLPTYVKNQPSEARSGPGRFHESPSSEGSRARSEASWERGYAAAVKFFREHGHLRVPRSYRSDGLRLDAWLGRQRAARRDGRLSAQRVEELSRLGMQWGVTAARASAPAEEGSASAAQP